MLAAGETAFLGGDFGRAEALLGKFLEDYGANPAVAEAVKLVKPLLALTHVRQKRFETALPLIEVALELDTTTPAQREELRFWLGVSLLQAGDRAAAQEAFGEFFADRSHRWHKRVEALMLFGTTDILRGDPGKAARFFEQQMVMLRERAPEAAGRAVVLQLHALIESGETAAGIDLVKQEYPRMGSITQLISYQSLVVRLGQMLLESGDYYGAIACLQRVWRKERLLQHQSARLETLEARLLALRERGVEPELEFQYLGIAQRMRRESESFRGTEGFDASVRFRLAAAFQGLGRYREAALVLEAMLNELPVDATTEQAAVNLVRCWMQIRRWSRALDTTERYESEFGGGGIGVSLPLVVFLRGECEQELGMYEEAAASFHRVYEDWPEGEQAPRALFMRGMVELRADLNSDAVATMRSFREVFPKHALVEESFYWEGMGYSFAKLHGECFTAMEHYLSLYPGGKHAAEAEFRKWFCRHSEAYYDEAIAGFRSFLEGHAGSPLADEARLLLGDALGATGEIDQAIAAYGSISPDSRRFFEDGWFKTGKAYWLTERTDEMREHFESFVERYPDSPRVAEAIYELGKIDLKDGRPEEAKATYWAAVRQLGDREAALGVEDILVALPRLYGGDSSLVELARDFDELRRWAESEGKRNLLVRAHWGRGKALESRSPELAAISFLDAGGLVDAERDSARVVVDCADARRAAGKPLVAERLYREARRWNPRAIERDRIYAGLGALAAEDGRHADAVDWYRRAREVTFRPSLRAQVTLAKVELQKESAPLTARNDLEGLLADKAVASENKARALLLYGELLEEGNETKKALAYYERVYVAYGKFRDEVAEAYLRRGRGLEKLEMPDEALEVYRELVGREELAEQDQVAMARERISVLSGRAAETGEISS